MTWEVISDVVEVTSGVVGLAVFVWGQTRPADVF